MNTRSKVLNSDPRYDTVKDYYGHVLQKSTDLKTDACCTIGSLPLYVQEALELVSNEIKEKYYGCGSPIPLCTEGLNILDLGCGTGRDCYVMSKLAGPNAEITGIDMTEGQIAVAEKYVEQQIRIFGYSRPNVNFIFDYIESLSKHFAAESLDLVTSNCVINLTEDKEAILRQVYNVLKFGGEMYFADIYADRRVPETITKDPVLRGECLGGALYYKDFERMARKVGFTDPRVVSKRNLEIRNKEIEQLVGNIRFCSITYRLWKLAGLEDACEDYGHIAIYKGQIPQAPFKFQLDNGHLFQKNKPERICGNTALMLLKTRFREYFDILGSFNEHFGMFENCDSISREDDAEPSNCCP